MKEYQLETFYLDFNYPVQYFYKREKNSPNGCPRYRVWFIDPEVNRTYETILSGYEDTKELVSDFLRKKDETFRLERIRRVLNEYELREFGNELLYGANEELPEVIPLAYTTAGDDEQHEMQVSYNRVTGELLEMFGGETKQRDVYTLEEFADMMEAVDFDDLIRDLWQYVDDEDDGKE